MPLVLKKKTHSFVIVLLLVILDEISYLTHNNTRVTTITNKIK